MNTVLLLLGTGAYLGGFGGSVKSPKLKRMSHYNTLTWPQNAGNPISQILSVENSPPLPPYREQPSCTVRISFPLCIRHRGMHINDMLKFRQDQIRSKVCVHSRFLKLQ